MLGPWLAEASVFLPHCLARPPAPVPSGPSSSLIKRASMARLDEELEPSRTPAPPPQPMPEDDELRLPASTPPATSADTTGESTNKTASAANRRIRTPPN